MPSIVKAYVTWEDINNLALGGAASNYYTKTEIDAFFEGEASGKKQVHWDRVTNKPSSYTPAAHDLVSAYHTASGLTVGYVPRATAATTFAWTELQHSDLGSVTSDQHHAEDHASRHKASGDDEILLDELGEPTDVVTLNASISKHGLFPKLSNKAYQCLNGIGAWLTLYDSTSIVIGILSKASDTTRNSNDDEQWTLSNSYDKIKETELGEPTGVMRIYFELKALDSGVDVYAKIYKNGSPIGTERSTQSDSYVPFTEDLGGFDSGDLIQIYAYRTGSTRAYVQNLRFQYDRSINILGECTLTTPITITTQEAFAMTHQDP